jgi:hypothetical protein
VGVASRRSVERACENGLRACILPCPQGTLQGAFTIHRVFWRFGRRFMQVPRGFGQNSLCRAARECRDSRREFLGIAGNGRTLAAKPSRARQRDAQQPASCSPAPEPKLGGTASPCHAGRRAGERAGLKDTIAQCHRWLGESAQVLPLLQALLKFSRRRIRRGELANGATSRQLP